MKKNTNLQLLLSLALASEIFYIAIASLGDLRQNVPIFLLCYGAAFVLYWAAARGFFDFGRNREKRKRQELLALPVSIPLLSWLERILHLQKFEDKLGSREILIIGLVFGLVFRITMLITEPSLSDDVYRYIWDGKVASHGINPFQHPPNADTLQTLRDSQYYPKINHREISTIYPPVSQMVFSVVYKIKPTVFAFKVVFLLFDLLTIAALLLLLKSLRLSLNRVLLYAWNPLIIVEFSGNAHADIIGIFFLVTALWLLAEKKLQWSNLFMVLSFLTKFITLLFLPILTALKKQNRILIVLSFVILTAAFYLPYADAGSNLFSGFLVYSSKWQFNGSIFAGILWLMEKYLPVQWVVDLMITPHGLTPDAETITTRTLDLALVVTKVVVGLIFVGIFTYFFMRLGKDLRRYGRLWLFKLGGILFGALFLLNPTVQPWYLCWTLPFLVIAPNRAFILWTGLVGLSYWILIDYTAAGVWQESDWVRWVEYTPFYGVLVFDFFAKKVKTRRSA